MIPVVTPAEMAVIDAGATEPVDVLIGRAGAAVARAALRRLGGSYGRRVVVVAGKGNNGADGRAAAARLRRRGVRVEVLDAAAADRLPRCDLVIDAAYGTGFRGEYGAPNAGDAEVMAVDIPSGVDGLSGAAGAGAVSAAATVTFAALKPGLLFGDGPVHAGAVEVADIGLDVSGAGTHVVEGADAARWLPRRRRDAHKWDAAVFVVAGSPGMTGAARLCALAAMRAGAGIVHLGVPGEMAADAPLEVVGRPLPRDGWDEVVLGELGRFRALVVGPGLGRADATAAAVRRLVTGATVPVVIDADGLFCLGKDPDLHGRSRATVLTPHEGEFARLGGTDPAPDRVEAVRDLASRTGATVLLKGPATVVVGPGGTASVVTSGDRRLATAGTGDVLAGVVGAFLAGGGATAAELAAAGAYVHGEAGLLGPPVGLVAGDLLDHLPTVLRELA